MVNPAKPLILRCFYKNVCYTEIANLRVSSAFLSLKKRYDENVTHVNQVFSLPRARVKVYIRVHFRGTLDLTPQIHGSIGSSRVQPYYILDRP